MELTNRSDGWLLGEYVDDRCDLAFSEVVQRHRRMVLAACGRICSDRNDAEDAAQAVFATLAAKAKALRDRPSIAGWLYQAAWRHAMRLRRSARTRRSCEARAIAAARPIIRPPRIEVEWGEARHELWRALAMLPDDQREALVLHHLENLSVTQVADLLGCPVGTVAARLVRARAALRERLTWRGVELPALAVESALIGDEWRCGRGEASNIAAGNAPTLASAQALESSGVTVGGAVAPRSVAVMPPPTSVALAACVTPQTQFGVSKWVAANWIRRALAFATVGSISVSAAGAAGLKAYIARRDAARTPFAASSNSHTSTPPASAEKRLEPNKTTTELPAILSFHIDTSATAVPEPSCGIALVFGAALLLPRCRRADRR